MTLRETVELADNREAKYAEQGGRCYICHKPVRYAFFQLAHRIPQRVWCLNRWGKEVIHSPLNMVGVCGLECNASAQMNPDTVEAEEFAEAIRGLHGTESGV
jgi:hypothetical protein